MYTCTILQSNIKGYHYFKICPHAEVPLVVEKEKGNIYDPDAMLIRMPVLSDTRTARRNEKEQTVKSNAGKQVGRVPANLCKMFKKLLDDGKVEKILC